MSDPYRDRLAAVLADKAEEYGLIRHTSCDESCTDAYEEQQAMYGFADALLAKGVVVDPAQALRDAADAMPLYPAAARFLRDRAADMEGGAHDG